MRGLLTNEMSGRLCARGWSDTDLAERAGMSRVRVNRIKNRRTRPTVGDALVIGRAFGLPVRALFELTGEARH